MNEAQNQQNKTSLSVKNKFDPGRIENRPKKRYTPFLLESLSSVINCQLLMAGLKKGIKISSIYQPL